MTYQETRSHHHVPQLVIQGIYRLVLVVGKHTCTRGGVCTLHCLIVLVKGQIILAKPNGNISHTITQGIIQKESTIH